MVGVVAVDALVVELADSPVVDELDVLELDVVGVVKAKGCWVAVGGVVRVVVGWCGLVRVGWVAVC